MAIFGGEGLVQAARRISCEGRLVLLLRSNIVQLCRRSYRIDTGVARFSPNSSPTRLPRRHPESRSESVSESDIVATKTPSRFPSGTRIFTQLRTVPEELPRQNSWKPSTSWIKRRGWSNRANGYADLHDVI